MARQPQAQSNHDWMVLQVANAYSRQGHRDIRADHADFPGVGPAQIGDHIPDVTAIHPLQGTPVICEVETADSIGTDHTHSQLLTFRQAANRFGGALHVGLPFKSDLVRAQQVVAGWNIPVDFWWYGDER